MSKIGKLPVQLAEGVSVTSEGEEIRVSGPRGNLAFVIPQAIEVKVSDGQIIVSEKQHDGAKALFGLTRAILANMVKGVTFGFEKKLKLSGVGYRAQVTGQDLVLSVGFSHTVTVKAPQGISFQVFENVIRISGIDKSLVGDTAAQIRHIRPPEPYKGKGISYSDERIRRKAGKAAKAVGGK